MLLKYNIFPVPFITVAVLKCLVAVGVQLQQCYVAFSNCSISSKIEQINNNRNLFEVNSNFLFLNCRCWSGLKPHKSNKIDRTRNETISLPFSVKDAILLTFNINATSNISFNRKEESLPFNFKRSKLAKIVCDENKSNIKETKRKLVFANTLNCHNQHIKQGYRETILINLDNNN